MIDVEFKSRLSVFQYFFKDNFLKAKAGTFFEEMRSSIFLSPPVFLRINVWGVFILTLQCISGISSESSEFSQNKTKISKHPVIIVVSYDGFRHDFMWKAVSETPNLDKIKAEGVSAPYMLNQFPTKTFPNHHSIATGLHTESHGVTDNAVFDMELNKTLGILDEEFYNYRNDVLPLWTLNELAGEGRVSGTMMWPGSNYPFGANRTLPTHSMKFDPTIPFEHRVDIALSWITNTTSPANLIYMYFEEPDEIAHGFGPDSEQVQTVIRRMDNLTGYLINKLKTLRIFEDVNLILLSDHGFEDVKETSIINISTIINSSLYDKYGASPVYNIKPRQDNLDILYSAFHNASVTSNFSVYKRDEIRTKRPYWFYSNNARRIMPIILVADSGFVFDDFVESMAYFDKKFNVTHTANRVYGVHGFDNQLMQMMPFFLSHGPLFRSAATIEPFYNVDLFPLICQMLKIPEPPNNGTDSLAQMILFKKGYHLRGPVGWVVGVSVVLALSILAGIMCLMKQHRTRQQPLLSSSNLNVSYRYVHNGEDSEDCLEETFRACTTGNGVPVMEVDEYQSLLTSSNEELS